MVIRALLAEVKDHFRRCGIENADREAEFLLRGLLHMTSLAMVLEKEKAISAAEEQEVSEAVRRRISGEPLQYILGTQEFMGLEFGVTPDVLIPRSDTETLVEAVLADSCGERVLELCTGSGCIAVSLAHFRPTLKIDSLDISERALSVARENAQKNAVEERIRFFQSDLLKEMPKGRYDVLVSNPPYIERDVIPTLQREVREHEPHLALDGGADGMIFYRRIAEIAPQLLNPGGAVYLEVGEKQAQKTAVLLEAQRMKTEIVRDLCGIERVVIGRI